MSGFPGTGSSPVSEQGDKPVVTQRARRAASQHYGYDDEKDLAYWGNVSDHHNVERLAEAFARFEQETLAALSASEGRDVGREALDRSWPDCLDPNAAHNRRPKRYRKTALIEAVQWFKDGDHPAVRMSDDIREAMVAGHAVPWIETLEGGHIVTPGDWIATGMKGEHWSIKPDVFAATYEEALSTPPAPEHPDMVGGKEGHSEAREALDELEAHEAALTKYRSGDA